ncbi:MAG: hypothetical protein HYV33_00220 [Candidatus Kerfeldbacteria bacterium]|nr:hypothetical protein [Candidatus Kerfeldbacteria bacterium]
MVHYVKTRLTATIMLVTVTLLGASCQPTDNQENSTITLDVLDDSRLGLALLTSDEVRTVAAVAQTHPALVEFNDHLQDRADESYISFVARNWFDPASGNSRMSNAISRYTSATEAAGSLALLVGDAPRLETNVAIGDSSLAVQTSDSVIYRFSADEYSVKIEVVATADQFAANDLLAVAEQLAQVQQQRLTAVAEGNITLTSNTAMERLPNTLTDLTALGTTAVTALEWRGVEHNFNSTTIDGFINGAMRRFQFNNQLDQIVEVTVMEFASTEQANEFQWEIIGQAPTIVLPDQLSNTANAVDFGELVELQSRQGNYVIDISIFAPFGKIDKTGATADLKTVAAEVLGNFVN